MTVSQLIWKVSYQDYIDEDSSYPSKRGIEESITPTEYKEGDDNNEPRQVSKTSIFLQFRCEEHVSNRPILAK